MIDTKGNQVTQEPLFPTTPTERAELQEQHLELLIDIAEHVARLKVANEVELKKIAEMRKKAIAILALLHASRPKK
jgi:hypothetical protein